MRRQLRRVTGGGGRVLLEPLEKRELLSAVIRFASGFGSGMGGGGLTINVGNPGAMVGSPVVPAQANQALGVVAPLNRPFIAAVARIVGLVPTPSLYTRFAVITWGDGATSLGGIVADTNGAIAVLGAHTYNRLALFPITMRIIAIPPAGSGQHILTLASTQSSARVISSPGGLSINPRTGIPFASNVGTFATTVPITQIGTTIDWGDGQMAPGTLVPLSRSGTTTTFAVFGSHRYAITHSYTVRVSILKPTGILTIFTASNVLPPSI